MVQVRFQRATIKTFEDLMDETERIQKWYKAQCNGRWENDYGISIATCDNPGWWVRVKLTGTALEGRSFTPIEHKVSAAKEDQIARGLAVDQCDRGADWMSCRVTDKVFDGAGDPSKLQAILNIFLDWAEKNDREPTAGGSGLPV